MYPLQHSVSQCVLLARTCSGGSAGSAARHVDRISQRERALPLGMLNCIRVRRCMGDMLALWRNAGYPASGIWFAGNQLPG
jgi:hypothetical protein